MLGPLLGAVTAAASLTFAPHTITLSDGRTVQAELGYLTVAERRADSRSRTIQLAVIRLKGTAPASAPPILFLPGSPDGASGSQTISIAALYPFFDALRGTGDVLIIDYRGSGLSRPAIVCPPEPYQPGTFASRESALNAVVGSGQRCAAALRGSGFDVAGYTWAEVAEDIAELRRELGVSQVSIVGFSSGTHAAQAFLRRHDREVSRLVMVGSEGLDDTRKLPNNVDRQLRAIGTLVSRDSLFAPAIPDFTALVRRVIDSLNRTPAIVEIPSASGEKLREPVAGVSLAYLTSKSISGPEEFAGLPALYYALSRGDASLLARVIQRFARSGGGGGNQLSYMLDGASGVSKSREARIALEAKTATLGDVVNFPFPEIHAVWGSVDLGARFREPIRSNVPSLFVTGALDGNTPPEQAETIRSGFSKSGRLIIRNGGHGSAFTTPAAWPLIFGFLQGKMVADEAVAAPPVRFLPLRK